jgi:hypothetical protein
MNKPRRMIWTAYVSDMGRSRRRWEDNIKMDLKGIGLGGMDWIHLAWNRDQWRAPVNKVTNLQVP